jgi:hypothetical protein
MQYDKETFKQWWEFLQLSKDFQSICGLVSKHKKRGHSDVPIDNILYELEKHKKYKPIERYMKLLAVYEKFGDVHRDNFEDWWENYNQPKSVKTKTGLDEYKEEKYRRINAAKNAHDELREAYEEIRGDIIYYPDTYTQCFVNIHSPIRKIKSHIGSVVKELKKEAEANQREELEARDGYLEILRLFRQDKYTMKQIINELATPSEKESSDVERTYRKKKQVALEILNHVEEGRFP